MPSVDSTEIWLFALGTACAVIGFMAVWILNSIKEQIKDINGSMQDLNKDLREGVTGLDRRVTIIEQQVNVCEWHRRSSNGHSE